MFYSKTPGCCYRKHPGVVVSLSLSYSHIKAITYIYKSILIRIRALYKLDILYKDRKNTGFFFENLIHKQCESLITMA